MKAPLLPVKMEGVGKAVRRGIVTSSRRLPLAAGRGQGRALVGVHGDTFKVGGSLLTFCRPKVSAVFKVTQVSEGA